MAIRNFEHVVVSRIVDGDTVEVIVDHGFYNFSKPKIRLENLNAAELNSSDHLEKVKAERATEFLESLVLNRQIFLVTVKPGKYNNRWIGTLYNDPSRNICYNDIMKEYIKMLRAIRNLKDIDLEKGYRISLTKPIL